MGIKENWKKNKVFYLISVIVLIAAVISIFSEYLGENPFAEKVDLVNPVQVCIGENRNYFIDESSERILITDKKNRLIKIIKGGDSEKTFEYVENISCDKAGAIYIHDRSFDEDGTTILSERIIKFNQNGKREKLIYETETLDEDGKQIALIDGMKVMDEKLYFCKITKKGVKVFRENGKNMQELTFASYDNKQDSIVDVDFSKDKNSYKIAIVLKNGDVKVLSERNSQSIYVAREHDTEEYFSLISEVTYSDNGDMYLCDIGQRQVYRISASTSQIETIISRGKFSIEGLEEFAELPLYTGLNNSNGTLSILTAEYIYDEINDEEIYSYGLVAIEESGEELFYCDSLNISMQRRIITVCLYLAIIIMFSIFVYAAIKMIRLLKKFELEGNVKIQLIMLATALVVTVCVSYVIFDSCNSRFVNEAASNLCNIAYLIGEKVDSGDLAEIDTPDDYFSEEYKRIDTCVRNVLKSKINKDNNVYCVLYKVKNDIVCEAYRDDLVHGSMYPMAGKYSGSIEEEIAKKNSYDISYEFALSEGTYMYALIPMYDENGDVLAFIETGTDYSTFNEENNSLYIKVLMLAAMAVIIIMLLFSEILCGLQAVREEKKAKREKRMCPPEVIRPLSFLFFAIANISTAFLPIYGMKLWNEKFPVPAELAAAFPLSMELIFAAVSAFVCGFIIRKAGIKAICILGGVLYISGNLLSAFAGNLWILILANAVCGTGSGCLSLALNTWAASYEEEEKQNRGFIHINAAYLAGLNCGTVIGSLIWESFGIRAAYFCGAIGAGVLILLCIIMIHKIEVVLEEEDDGESGSLKDLLSPSVIRYFLCICVPYLICTAFLEYFFPIEAEASGLSAAHISMAFLLSGLISIYTGSSLAEPITAKIGTKKAMMLASFLYAAALIYLVINPTIMSCYVVVVLFALADSFGLSAQSVYFSSMPQVKKAGQSKALGVNSTVESITSACGSLIFGAVLAFGTQKGILIIAVVFSALLVVYALAERNKNKEQCME